MKLSYYKISGPEGEKTVYYYQSPYANVYLNPEQTTQYLAGNNLEQLEEELQLRAKAIFKGEAQNDPVA